MNCTETNKISIVGYISSQGIQPAAEKDGNAWYCSPFRKETRPSFKVNRIINQWYDFGTGENGKLVDLVAKLIGSDISGALIHLQQPGLKSETFSFGKQEKPNQNAITNIIGFRDILSVRLMEYISSRGINLKLASQYLKEVYHTDNKRNRKFFSLGIQNDLGGWELRSILFKGGTSPKYYTTIPGNTDQVNIFEGMFDFLSCLVHYRTTRLKNQTIILNSLVNLQKINLNDYKTVNLFLDNDTAGRQAAEKIKSTHHQVTDYSQILYPDHKDFNEFLCSQKIPKTLKKRNSNE